MVDPRRGVWLIVVSALLVSTCVSERTIVFIYAPTVVGQNVFMRGGINEAVRECVDGDAAADPCAVPLVHTVVPADTSSSFYQWSQGDQYLDWYGPEPGQGEYQNTPAGGTPLIWTTSIYTPGDATVEQDGRGYTSYNRFGAHFWMLDVDMDCSKTEAGWFEFKTFTLPEASGGWEPDIDQYLLCAGAPSDPSQYPSNNHLARCGRMNLFYEEYGECNVWDIPSAPSVPPPDGCGHRKMFESSQELELDEQRWLPGTTIVNGEAASIGRWPWQGVLQYSSTIGGCAGVLLDSDWAITAAHCVRGTDPAILKIRFGEQNLLVTQGNEQAIQVQDIVMHPMYQHPDNEIYNDYDVAMLQLQTSVDLDASYIANPACLPYGYATDDFVGANCWATGFGDTKGTADRYRLNEVNVPVWTAQDCFDDLGTDRVTIRQICMGTSTESACGGDSGGPLVCHMDGRWVLVGTTSWGAPDCQNGPSVYSRVTEFLDWIDSVRGYKAK